MDYDEALKSEKRDRLPSWEWEKVRGRVFERDGFVCKSCGDKEFLVVDHVVPVGLGGDDGLGNLKTLCSDCHKNKTVQDHEMIRRIKKSRKKRVCWGFE